MATFSVIVPVYNAEHTIERCVDSIAASGGDAVQIILIEDCSKDRSWEVCQQLAKKYTNVVCLHNEQNRGVSYTRNRGLDAATGEYLLFVDSDDWVDPGYIPAFQQVVSAGCLFAICGYINHDEKYNGRTDIFAWDDFEGTKQVPLCQQIEALYNARLLQQLWNKVFVTDAVRQNGIRFDESISIGEDTRFILDYIQRSGINEITLINRPLYHYMRDQDGSLMFRVGYESVEEPLKNLRKLYEIMGLSGDELENRLAADRQKQIDTYAYLIMHNASMGTQEKKRLILALGSECGINLFRKNHVLYFKEKVIASLTKLKYLTKKIPVWIKGPLVVATKELGKLPFPLVICHIRCSYFDNKASYEGKRLSAYQEKQCRTYQYLDKKYGSYIDEQSRLYSSGKQSAKFPVWIFWWQGEESAPDLVKRCLASVRKNANGHPVRVITASNYENYVKIPDYIVKKLDAGIISLTHFSDILRMNLLAEHGGFWLDATIFCAKEIGGDEFSRPIFTGRNPGKDPLNISRWDWTGYAIYGQQGNALFCLARDFFNAYWRDHDYLVDYYLIDYTIRLIYNHVSMVAQQIDSIPVNNTDIYYFQEHFADAYNGNNYPGALNGETWLFKLTWKTKYPFKKDGKDTVYFCWCTDNKLT